MTTQQVNQTQKTNFNFVQLADNAQVDAFGNMRVSMPTYAFDAQLTYDLQPLLYEQITAGVGTVTYDSTNGCAILGLSAPASGATAEMRTFEYFRYQPGRSQKIVVTGRFGSNTSASGVTKGQGYSDGVNGIEFQVTSAGPQVAILSSTSNGNQIATQAQWNIDRLDGSGSGLILDLTKTHILVIDLQALYAGRVRIGFDINGQVVYCHEFNNANISAWPYIRDANLPIRSYITTTGTTSDSMLHLCSSVASESGAIDLMGYEFSVEGTGTAGNGTATHILSLQPALTYDGRINRMKLDVDDIEILNLGTVPVLVQICLGCTLTGANTFTNVNSTYSGMAYNTGATLSGTPAIVTNQTYVTSTGANKASTTSSQNLPYREPITLDHLGNPRILGTLSVLATGIGGTASVRAVANWHEIR